MKLTEHYPSSDQDWVYGVIRDGLGLLEGPCPWRPRWWEFELRRRERHIQRILSEAGLPPLTEDGRKRYFQAEPQGFEDAGGAWSRKWCAALGLAYRDAFTTQLHPRTIDAARATLTKGE